MALSRFECPAPLAARGFSLHAEAAADTDFLRRLFVWQRWGEMAPLPWDDAQKVALLESQFSLQQRQYASQYPGVQFLVLAEAGGPVGRLYLAELDREIRIVDVLFHPERRGQGIGAALLAGVQDRAAERGLGVSLHVDKTNPALRLYRRLGFLITADTGISWCMEWRAAL